MVKYLLVAITAAFLAVSADQNLNNEKLAKGLTGVSAITLVAAFVSPVIQGKSNG